MEKHFVVFLSPGTFVSETSQKPIDSLDVAVASEMARSIKERHNATPYGFQFVTRSRGPDDLDSHETARSHIYWLSGTVETADEILARDNPNEHILRANIRCNGFKRIITNTNSWKFTAPLNDDDVVLDWQPSTMK